MMNIRPTFAGTWLMLLPILSVALLAQGAGPNRPPEAIAGHDQTVGTAGAQPVAVTLNGSASSDPDGDPLSYVWRDTRGRRIGSTPTVSVNLTPGTYTFSLTVSDGRGGTASDGLTVIVIGDTDPPIVIPPPDLTVGITTAAGAKGSDDDDLARFLTSSHAGDWLDPSPIFLDARVNDVAVGSSFEFPIGATPVTFRWRDHSDNVGSGTATVTVLDHLKKGDLLIGQSVPSGYASFGRITRVRNRVAATFCETPSDSSDPMFWDGPTELILDSKGQVIFLASAAHGFRLMRCTRPGVAPELIADFRHDAVDAPATAALPFPTYAFADPSTGYFHFSGLHLATRKVLTVNTDLQSVSGKIADDETYNFQALFFTATEGGQVKTVVYHVATGLWDTNGPEGVTRPTGHMFFNGGTTYAVDGNVIRGIVDPLHIDAGLKVGDVFSGKLSLMLGGSVKQYDNLIMNDRNIPDFTFQQPPCKGMPPVPLVGGGFAPLSGMYGVVYDTWGSFGLSVLSGYGPAAPFLTNLDENIFERNGFPDAFPQPFNNCNPTPQIHFVAPLPFYSPRTGGSNSVDRVASTSLGLIGTRFWGNDVVKVPASGADAVETVIDNLWHPMGIAGFPAKVAPGYGVVVGISIQSPVNILMTDAQGRRIGMDLQTGAPINDFGTDGVDSGPGTEPRYFFVKDPAPGPYSVQTVGTGDGPYTVDVYSADSATGLASRLTHTGTAAPGSVASHDFALGDNVRLGFTATASTNRVPTASGGANQTVDATSAAGALVHLDASASSDPDGDTLTYLWNGPFGVLTGAVVNPLLPVGQHALTVTVADGHGGSAKATVMVTVNGAINTAPIANAGPDQLVEATSTAGAAVVLNGSASSDPDHDALTFTWSGAFGVASGMTASVAVPFGTHPVALTVDDGHGHTAVATMNVTVRDTTAPLVTCGIADIGWHNTDAAVACKGADGGSGLANPANATFTLTTSVADGTETATAATNTQAVCDVSGNCATAGPIGGNKVDKKSPAITIASPSASYVVGANALAGYTCADAGSGVSTCTGSAPNGTPLDLSTPGTRTFSVNAADGVGNTSTALVSYTVGYGVCLVADQDDHGHEDEADDNDGRVVKLQLCTATGANRSLKTIVLTATSLINAATGLAEVLQPAGEGNRGLAFRFEPSLGGAGGGYVFKLRTKGLSSGAHTLYFSVAGDPTVHGVTIVVSRAGRR